MWRFPFFLLLYLIFNICWFTMMKTQTHSISCFRHYFSFMKVNIQHSVFEYWNLIINDYQTIHFKNTLKSDFDVKIKQQVDWALEGWVTWRMRVKSVKSLWFDALCHHDYISEGWRRCQRDAGSSTRGVGGWVGKKERKIYMWKDMLV